MPQMAPISWIILFCLFSFSFIMFNILNYFCFLKFPSLLQFSNNNNNTLTKNKVLSAYNNWKW